jgi:hypothetical protein
MSFSEIREWLEKTEQDWPPENAQWIYSKQVQNFLSVRFITNDLLDNLSILMNAWCFIVVI